MHLLRRFAFILLILCTPLSQAADGPRQYLKKPAPWFTTDDAKRVAANILSHQSDLGGWPKNIDTAAQLYTGDRNDLKPTFDNGATTDELLAPAVRGLLHVAPHVRPVAR